MIHLSLHSIEFYKGPNPILYGFFLLFISFVITYVMTPVIIAAAEYKDLMVRPNQRSSHIKHTPTFGGVAFYGSLMICIFFMQYVDPKGISFNIVAAACILFFMGLKDDLLVLSTKTKVLLQTGAIVFIILNPELLVTDFHGFLGLNQIPAFFSFALSYIIVLYIINAYNLIDGIDGLAGMLGIVISAIFAVFFYITGLLYYFFLALLIIGFLLAFLRFNLSSKKKVFMGDTGSMITGSLIGIMTLRFLTLDESKLEIVNIKPENGPIVAMAILFFPAIDVLRVIIMRIINKRGPFTADRCHLHHIFVDKGLNHKIASITITVSNVLVFTLIYVFNRNFSNIGLLFVFFLTALVTFYILLLLDKDPSTKNRRKKVKSYIPKWIYHIEFRIRKSIIIILKKVFYKNLL